jgi:hypothetical protein
MWRQRLIIPTTLEKDRTPNNSCFRDLQCFRSRIWNPGRPQSGARPGVDQGHLETLKVYRPETPCCWVHAQKP